MTLSVSGYVDDRFYRLSYVQRTLGRPAARHLGRSLAMSTDYDGTVAVGWCSYPVVSKGTAWLSATSASLSLFWTK